MRKNARVLSLCLLLALVLSLGMPAAFADDAAAPAVPTEPAKDVQPTVTKPVNTLAAPTADGARAWPVHEHNWVYTETVPATCTKDGYDLYECSTKWCLATDKRENGQKATGHNMQWTSGAKADDIDNVHHQVCIVCGHTQNYQLHTNMLITDEAVDATCTQPGHTAGKYCPLCDYDTRIMSPALGHKEEIIPGKAATCTEDGLTEGKKCSVCGEILEPQEIIPATGHKWEYQSIDDKQHTSKCSVCGEEKTEDHTLVEKERVEATCTEKGSYKMDCPLCNYSKDYVIEAIPHKEEIIPGKAATCTEPGLTEGKKCSVCNEILEPQEIIPAGHKWEYQSIDDKQHTLKCSVCGEEKTEDHTLVEKERVEATCTENGSYKMDCTLCNYSKDYVIKATGHKWGCISYTDDGHTLKCSVCGEEKTEGHTLVEKERVDATCTKDGSYKMDCTLCNYSKDYVIKATGHDWGAWANTGDGKTHVRVCKNDPSHKESQRHQMGPWEVVKHNTETTDGYMQRWCLAPDCDYHETRVIKAGVPKTGDSSNILLYSGLCLAAVCGTAGVLVYVKRKKAE